jgi:repressor LexA
MLAKFVRRQYNVGEVRHMTDNLGEKLSALRRGLGLSQRELAARLELLGVSVTNQAVSKWEKGLTQPSAEQFLALCRALEVESISMTFLGGESGITHGLNAEGARRVREYADVLRASGMFSPREPAIKKRILPLYSLAVSAGTGQFLDSSDYTPTEVGDEVPLSADFGVRVAGDSMAPRYQDGQIVWVSSRETLESGETGVFLYDDCAYIKRLVRRGGRVYLHSENPAYEDIEIGEYGCLHVLGRAVT